MILYFSSENIGNLISPFLLKFTNSPDDKSCLLLISNGFCFQNIPTTPATTAAETSAMTVTMTRTATARAPAREGGGETMLGRTRTVRTTIVRAVGITVSRSRTNRTSLSQSGLPG